MSVKLRQLAELDLGFAMELEAFFKKDGISEEEYLEMTINDFIKFCESKLNEYCQQFMGGMQKLERRRPVY